MQAARCSAQLQLPFVSFTINNCFGCGSHKKNNSTYGFQGVPHLENEGSGVWGLGSVEYVVWGVVIN